MLPSSPRPSCTDSTGHCTDDTRRAGIIWRLGPRIGPRSTSALVACVAELAEAGRINRQIADALNAEGFRPPSGQPIPGGHACTLVSQRNIRETAIKNAGDSWDALKAAAGGGLGHLDSAQSSTPTSRLQEVRPPAPNALAAAMARTIALTALAALGFSGRTFHEPFHANDG